MTCAQLRTKTWTSISWKICCVKSGFQILYAVEQFSSLFSKDKLKQGAHIHQTHDPPSPRMSWENCRAVPSQQLQTCFVELTFKGFASAGKGLSNTSFSQSLTDGNVLLMSPSKGETAVHGCWLPAWYGCTHAWCDGRGLVYVCPLL